MKKSAIPTERDRDHQPVDPRGALAQIPAPDEGDVNRRGVLQEDGVGRGRHPGREDKENDRPGITERAADLRRGKGETRPADAEQDDRDGDGAPGAGDRHRRPVDRLDQDAAEAPAERREEQEDGRQESARHRQPSYGAPAAMQARERPDPKEQLISCASNCPA